MSARRRSASPKPRNGALASDIDLLFVYGTLRRGCDNDQARRLAAESEWLGRARLTGRLYRVDAYPALVPEEGEGGGGEQVTGDLVRLRDPAATLAWIDAYEETGAGFSEPWEYRRGAVIVDCAGDGRRAWTYIYNRPAAGLERITPGDWPTE